MASDHEDEDDDLYSASETKADNTNQIKDENDGSSSDEPMDEGADSGDDDDDNDDDEEDSDSDIDIIIDKPQAAPKPATIQQAPESKAIKIEAPPQSTPTPSQPSQPLPTGIVPQLSAIPGTSFPALRTSTIDVNDNPVYPPQGKPLLQVDMDADLAEEQKIWRRPGEDQSDYFNYGFDEFTWETYRQRQMSMAGTIEQQKNDMVQMQQMMGGGMPGMPSMPGPGPVQNNAPGGVPTGPAGGVGGGGGAGSINEQQQMEMMFQQMVSQGMDPSQMDFGSFMQMAGQGMGGFPGGPGGQQGGFQQGNQ
ncbi:Fip1 motif-domain-containing protein, partial [Phaeosphaeriaceae sp. PMI808]